MYEYVKQFEDLGFGMFVHFGLYSILGKGEWVKSYYGIEDEKYEALTKKFKVKKTWAKELVAAAKAAGCKYITLTSRHHDGFSLYDTKGLNTYDAPHSAAGRDLVREFVDECNKAGIRPFFYHTLIDWRNKDCEENFPAYIDYLVKSVEILCTEYGEIGGLWFDGWWDKPTADWQFDRLYAMIRCHQPHAMIINNTGMEEGKIGTVGHPEIDSVTYERGVARPAPKTDRPVAGEMCEVLFDHWGYSAYDLHYKPLPFILEELVKTRACGCNFLLNVGPMGNGSLRPLDAAYLAEIGKWIKYNKGFIYKARPVDIKVENAEVFIGEDGAYYAVSVCPTEVLVQHESLGGKLSEVHFPLPIKSARWLDSGKSIKAKRGVYTVTPFNYGINMHLRVARIVTK